MSFDWNDYLKLSKSIERQASGTSIATKEAWCRSAVSRTYYAVFHIATKFAVDNLEYIVPARNNHWYLREFYMNQRGNHDYMLVGRKLTLLLKNRKDCDYKEEYFGNIESLVNISIREAEKIKQLLPN
ncbi:hypothetical protein ACFL05_00905 [Patescibacteria group bacterium]